MNTGLHENEIKPLAIKKRRGRVKAPTNVEDCLNVFIELSDLWNSRFDRFSGLFAELIDNQTKWSNRQKSKLALLKASTETLAEKSATLSIEMDRLLRATSEKPTPEPTKTIIGEYVYGESEELEEAMGGP